MARRTDLWGKMSIKSPSPTEAAAAYAPELIHACGEGIEKRKPLNDPFCYQLGFLDGHAFAMSSPEVLALVEALKFYAQKPEPDIMSTFAKSAADWGEQCTTWGPLVDLGAIARITLAAFAKQPGGSGG